MAAEIRGHVPVGRSRAGKVLYQCVWYQRQDGIVEVGAEGGAQMREAIVLPTTTSFRITLL